MSCTYAKSQGHVVHGLISIVAEQSALCAHVKTIQEKPHGLAFGVGDRGVVISLIDYDNNVAWPLEDVQ
ncbi:hypothetical protein [Variovorax sp. dw_954]|uniref:hypothetical protein n=1 Tax=Variovorax sp. dw_954 TaxID=2720078 RepID=UPI001BD3DE94|nr:hypothetical protein [Variovorax sp. dw_954]